MEDWLKMTWLQRKVFRFKYWWSEFRWRCRKMWDHREYRKYLKALENKKLDTKIGRKWQLIGATKGCEIYYDPKTLREPIGGGRKQRYDEPERPYVLVEERLNGGFLFSRLNKHEFNIVKHEMINLTG